MPAKSPSVNAAVAALANKVGQEVRKRRMALGVTAVAAAEAAGMSRVTWHRIERGELSVTFGAYLSALDVLDLPFAVGSDQAGDGAIADVERDWLPLKIHLSKYPQLRQLAWQVKGVEVLGPREAWSFYQRNWRHVDAGALEPAEQQLIAALEDVFGEVAQNV